MKRRSSNLTGATRKRQTSWIQSVRYFATKTPTSSSIRGRPDSRKCTQFFLGLILTMMVNEQLGSRKGIVRRSKDSDIVFFSAKWHWRVTYFWFRFSLHIRISRPRNATFSRYLVTVQKLKIHLKFRRISHLMSYRERCDSDSLRLKPMTDKFRINLRTIGLSFIIFAFWLLIYHLEMFRGMSMIWQLGEVQAAKSLHEWAELWMIHYKYSTLLQILRTAV